MISMIQPLERVAIHLGPIPVYWYGLIIGSAVFIGLWIATRESVKQGLDNDVFVDLLIYAVPISIISARIYYVIFKWSDYADNPIDIFKIWEGGIAIYGSLIGAVATTYFYTKAKRISFWKMADIAAPSLILGQAIGRWGNFMNQEAYGSEVAHLNYLPDFISNQMYINGVYHHPTFLYESMWNLAGFVLLLILRSKVKSLRNGELFLSYITWYALGRFFIEGMRTDSLYLFNDFIRVSQLLSLVLFFGGLAAILLRRKLGYATNYYNEPNAKKNNEPKAKQKHNPKAKRNQQSHSSNKGKKKR